MDTARDANAQAPTDRGIDLGPYLAGETGALERAAAQLGEASEALGFYFVANHGMPQSLIDRVFAEAERFHSLPLERKMAVKVQGKRVVGYLPLGRADAAPQAFGPHASRPQRLLLRQGRISARPSLSPRRP